METIGKIDRDVGCIPVTAIDDQGGDEIVAGVAAGRILLALEGAERDRLRCVDVLQRVGQTFGAELTAANPKPRSIRTRRFAARSCGFRDSSVAPPDSDRREHRLR